jgi:signal transduction histidine kinase
MLQNRLFTTTRWRLASYYAGVMGLILSLCSVAAYQVAAQQGRQSLQQELESISSTLHDGLEPQLLQPGQIDANVQSLLPGLCLSAQKCPKTESLVQRHILGKVQQETYYLRFTDRSGRTIATLGKPPKAQPIAIGKTPQQLVNNDLETEYIQLSLLLKNQNDQPWGYMEIGRSLVELNQDLDTLKCTLWLGLSIAMLLILVASWVLAGIAMRPIYQSYGQVQQFTADAAHELRTPLAAIQATIESKLNAYPLSDSEVRSVLEILARQTHRLCQLAQDLLFLSQVDARPQKPKLQCCCLNDLVEDLVEELSAFALSSKVWIVTDAQIQSPIYVIGQTDQLYRLVSNLIANAIRYNYSNGKVIVRLRREGRAAILLVQDTGIGIEPEKQSQIFDRFYRVSPDRSRLSGGTGLGLAIAQAIVKAHQGSIQVHSELDKGSTFIVRFPIALMKKSVNN